MIRSAVALVPWSLRRHVKSIPGLAQLQRWLVARTLDGTSFEHRIDAGPARGVRFWVHMPEDKGIWTGAYEHGFAARIAAAMKPGFVAYDVGGWHGFFAGVMAANGAAKVAVFEPLPANIERIRKLVALNPALPLELHEMALSDQDGTAEFMVMPETSMAKLTTSQFQPHAASGTRISVRTATIDGLVEAGSLPPPDLMKLDVEGAEMMVLRGARQVLARHRPVIFAEIHSSALLAEAQAWLAELGYRVRRIDEDEAAAERRDVFQIQAVAA